MDYSLRRISLSRILLMGALLILLLSITVSSTGASSHVHINEIRIDQPSTDNDEYFELAGAASTSLDGLTYIVIGDGAAGSGMIEAVADLAGLSIPSSGYFVAAETTFTLGSADLTTDLNFENSDNVTHMLVTGFTGSSGDDLDTDDDGVLDVVPWTTVVDSVALIETVGSGDLVYSPNTIGPDGSFVPGHVYACPAGWQIGAFAGGDDTPGAANNCPVVVPDVTINEIRIDQPSTDNDEYFELAGAASTSLDGLTYIVIGDGTGGSGVIEAVADLTGSSIPSSGYFVAAEATFTLGTADLTTDLNFENSDNVTHMLVAGFSGANGDDLDTDDDGTFDIMPWSAVVDSVALIETTDGSGEQVYSPNTVGPDGTFVPGHVYACPAGWQIGAFGGGDDTPGAASNCPFVAPDVMINEIRIDQPSTDNDEYFELAGEAGASLDGLTYISIGDGTGGSGVIEAVADLTGLSIPSSGYFVAAETTFTLGTADLTTNLNFENSDNVTHMLVAGFSGADGDDLDTDDDGTFDSTPWTAVVDSVSLIETVGSGDQVYSPNTVGPDGTFVPGHVFICDGSWQIGAFGGGEDTPGAANSCETPPPTEICGDPFTPIYTIQGNGLASTFDGTEVSTEGIVVGDFQFGMSGFNIQDPTGDGDPATSDGIFVYSTDLDVNEGDHVRVRGTVDEFFNLTEITSVSLVLLCSSGNAMPAPEPLSLPVTSVNDFEAFEGMLVTFPQTLYISEYFNFDRFGEIVLTPSRLFQPTNIYAPGPQADQLAVENSLSRITLDDGRTWSNPNPARHPNGLDFDLSNLFRGGDTVQNVTGVMDYNFGAYKIQPTQGADYTAANPRPTSVPDVGGFIKVAGFNVLNYFTSIDDGIWDCGPSGTLECRGADTPEEFTRQRDKIISAIVEMDADIIGVNELENNATAAIMDLVDGLNAVAGAGTYDFIDTGTIGTDAIKVALIYKPASATPSGSYAVLDSSVDPLFLDTKNRPALAQTFIDLYSQEPFTVVVNHLKSKGSPCDDVGDPNAGLQGNCNGTRTDAAVALANWLATDPTGSGDADFLIIGDLNSYAMEDPIMALEAAGYTNLVEQYGGMYAYSYVFDGQLGYLDHALANGSMLSQVSGTTVWHINTDEPDLIDYDMTFKADAQDALYEPNAYRSSDHDPVIVGLCTDTIAPILNLTATPDDLWPVNHKYVDVFVGVEIIDADPNVQVTLVSVASNEPDNGLGDGDKENDIVVVDDFNFQLRAERSGKGDGRVYTITYKAVDACGNESYTSVEVTVSHDMQPAENQGNKPTP